MDGKYWLKKIEELDVNKICYVNVLRDTLEVRACANKTYLIRIQGPDAVFTMACDKIEATKNELSFIFAGTIIARFKEKVE